MRLCEYLAEFLKEHGVTDAFGIPGSLIMPVWQELDGIIHLCTNEADAAYIATGYGKASKKPGVVITTASPGVTNSISGIASAYMDSVPLIHISGSIPIAKQGMGMFQEESTYDRAFLPENLLASVTKKCFHPQNAKEAVRSICEGWFLATSGRCGSVHISLPIDIQNENVDCYLPCDLTLNENSTGSSFNICNRDVCRPLIIVGWGAYMSGCSEKIFELAEKWRAPVLCTMKGMSAINSKNEFFLSCMGFMYSDRICKYLKEYRPESIWVFGSSVGEKDFPPAFFELCTTAKWHIISKEFVDLRRHNADIDFHPTEKINEILDYLIGLDVVTSLSQEIAEVIKEYKESCRKEIDEKCSESDLMGSCIKYICQQNDTSQVIVGDAGNHYLDALAFIEPNRNGNFYIDVGLAAMGIGISETIGMAYSSRDRRYVVITGDGCMLMNGSSIYNAAADALPIVFVVFNNFSLGRVKEGQKTMGKFVSSDIKNVDFTLFARSLGIKNSVSVDNYDDFISAYNTLLHSDDSALLEVRIYSDETPVLLKQ